MSWPVIKFSEAISRSGLFSDGDWVESKDQDPEGDVRLVQLADIGVGEFIDKSNRFMTSKRADELRCSYLKAGDILVARMPDPIGRACIFPEGMGKCVTVVDVCIVRPGSERIDNRWLMHLINSERFRNQIDRHVTGTTRQRISRGNLAGLEIPLPPLHEQKRIAAILDKADAIRRKRQQAIQLADDFLRAVFLDMFGDPNSNPKNADVLPMTEVFDIRTGKLNSNAATEGGKYPFFTCAKEIFAIDEYAFDQEALLLAGNNAQADYDVKHYKGRFNAYQRTYVLTLRDSTWSYPFNKFALQYQLSNLKYASKGSSTKYITTEIMGRTMLPVPGQEDQKKFVDHFERVGSVQAALLVQAQNDESLFSALSNRAFSGQL